MQVSASYTEDGQSRELQGLREKVDRIESCFSQHIWSGVLQTPPASLSMGQNVQCV